MTKHVSKSLTDTQNLAESTLSSLGERHVLALSGDLGSGKTTFSQSVGGALGVDHMPSPTFTLMNVHKIIYNPELLVTDYELLVHVDCYRLETPEELMEIGLQEYLEDPKALVIIEWAEKIESLLPAETMRISFEHGQQENERILVDTSSEAR